MQLTCEQICFINKHINHRYIDEAKLIDYIEKNDIIDNHVFKACSKVKIKRTIGFLDADDYGFNSALYNDIGTVERDVFIKRIPFIFYFPGNEKNAPKMYNYYSGPRSNNLEKVFECLEFLYYEMQFSLQEIFSYPTAQVNKKVKQNDDSNIYIATESVSEAISDDKYKRLYANNIFIQWVHYIKLCNKLGWNDYYPRCFITAYNKALESSGLEPIIYSPRESKFGSFYRNGKFLYFNGVFPRDDNGQPILKWTRLKVENYKSVYYSGDYSMPGELKIEITPTTRIYWEEDDGYSLVYSGPLNMEFDFYAIKQARKEKGYTQKDIAQAIGVADRTYQKWESGETIPDGFHLIRIMNWLEIDDVRSLIKDNYFEGE